MGDYFGEKYIKEKMGEKVSFLSFISLFYFPVLLPLTLSHSHLLTHPPFPFVNLLLKPIIFFLNTHLDYEE